MSRSAQHYMSMFLLYAIMGNRELGLGAHKLYKGVRTFFIPMEIPLHSGLFYQMCLDISWEGTMHRMLLSTQFREIFHYAFPFQLLLLVDSPKLSVMVKAGKKSLTPTTVKRRLQFLCYCSWNLKLFCNRHCYWLRR